MRYVRSYPGAPRLFTAGGLFSSLSSVAEYSRVHGEDHDIPPASGAARAGGEVSGEFGIMRVVLPPSPFIAAKVVAGIPYQAYLRS